MKRRTFMALGGVTGAASLLGTAHAAENTSGRYYYELRRYRFDTEEQEQGFEQFMAEAAVPALNRIGIEPVGVMKEAEAFSPVYVLLPHPTLESVATMTQRLMVDPAFLSAGAEFIDAPTTSPAFARFESSLLHAFTGMPQPDRPVSGPDRVLQLRIYESPSVAAGQIKIEMFNVAEIEIFHKTGLTPVFYAEAIVGDKMPNLTYMLGFENMEELQAAWKRFSEHPDWKALLQRPRYSDPKIVNNITNLILKPTAASQI